jgi:hypothetical protein
MSATAVTFMSSAPPIPEKRKRKTALFEGSQALPACPSDKNIIKMKMRKEHWCNDTDR